MCGIAGYYGEGPIKDQQIQRCLKLMHRRGPDHAEFFQHTNAKGRYVYLLSSRLSILDLEDRSNQPFHLGPKSLVYNGELYNYFELKQKLIAQNKKPKPISKITSFKRNFILNYLTWGELGAEYSG